MNTILYINPLDLQRAVSFTAPIKDGVPAQRNVQIEYKPTTVDEQLGKTVLGTSLLRATDSFRMIEVETCIDTKYEEHGVAVVEAGTWYIDQLDALAAIAEAKIKKLPYAICKVNDEVQSFPNAAAMWEKPAETLSKVSFSSKLLVDSIKAIKCQNVRLEFAGEGQRVLIQPDNKRIRALLMPIRD